MFSFISYCKQSYKTALYYSNDNSDSDSPLPPKPVRRNNRHYPDTVMKVFFPNCEGRLKCTEREKKINEGALISL